MIDSQTKTEYVRRVFSHFAANRKTKVLLSELEKQGIYLDRTSVSRFSNGISRINADVHRIYEAFDKIGIDINLDQDEVVNISKVLTRRFCAECPTKEYDIRRFVGEYKIYRHAWMFGMSREYIIVGDLKIENAQTEFRISETINASTPARSYIGPEGTDVCELHEGVIFKAESGYYAVLGGGNVNAFMFMSFKPHIWHKKNTPRVLRGTLTSSLDDGEVYIHKFEAIRLSKSTDIDGGIYKRSDITKTLSYEPYY